MKQPEPYPYLRLSCLRPHGWSVADLGAVDSMYHTPPVPALAASKAPTAAGSSGRISASRVGRLEVLIEAVEVDDEDISGHGCRSRLSQNAKAGTLGSQDTKQHTGLRPGAGVTVLGRLD
jgi:hypothetical protein